MPQNEIDLIVGKKGSGKTMLARHLVKNKRRLIAFDPQRQFSDCGVVLDNWKSLAVYMFNNRQTNFRAIYQPAIRPMSQEPGENDNRDEVKVEFRRLCWYIDTWFKNLYFLVDEIDKALDPRDNNGFFKNMLNRGRHTQISLVATTIRYTDVQRSFTAQADKVISFHAHEPADIKYLSGYFGKELAAQLPQLPPYHYIMCDNGRSARHEPIRI